MKKLIPTLALIATGCAMTYTPPQALSPRATERLLQPKTEVFNAAKRALVSDGYQITSADEGSGTISTAPRDMRLSPEFADCGTTLGIDYLLDNRTSTRVAMGILINELELEAKASVQGEYKPGSPTHDITLTCVSRGLLERDMLAKINAETNRQ